MRIRIKNDGRELEGTPLQIVQAMRALAFGREDQSVESYIAWVAEQLSRLMAVTIDVNGDTVDAQAMSLVNELIRTGFAERI
jgi:hypothetical protein